MRCYSCRKYDDCERPWKCDGTMYDCTAYELEQTNEEWMKTLNTEQLADKLTDFSFWLVFAIPTEDKREKVRKRIVEWLKQPHREIGK